MVRLMLMCTCRVKQEHQSIPTARHTQEKRAVVVRAPPPPPPLPVPSPVRVVHQLASLAQILRAPGPEWADNSCAYDSTVQAFYVFIQYMGGTERMLAAGGQYSGAASAEEFLQSMTPPAQALIESLRERERLQIPMSMY